jgi:hypothetical protein
MKKSIYVFAVTVVIATLVISSTANIPMTKNAEKDDNPVEPLVTKTDYFSIPGGAFNPEGSSMTYTSDGMRISGEGKFYAPVYLPNEAKVTKLLFYWSDYYGADDGTASLERYSFGSPSSHTMAEASTSGSTGSGASEDSSIDNEEIDNSQYSYFVALDFPASIISCYNVVIEYNYEPLSASANMIYEENQMLNVVKSPGLLEQ